MVLQLTVAAFCNTPTQVIVSVYSVLLFTVCYIKPFFITDCTVVFSFSIIKMHVHFVCSILCISLSFKMFNFTYAVLHSLLFTVSFTHTHTHIY